MGSPCITPGCCSLAQDGYPCTGCYQGKPPRVAPTACIECLGAMPSYTFGRPRRYCSKRCHTKAAKRTGRKAEQARARGASNVHYVNPLLVFERDGYRCCLCHVETPADARGTHADNEPTIDHRIAAMDGGHHTYENIQTLCRRCNVEKGKEEGRRATNRYWAQAGT